MKTLTNYINEAKLSTIIIQHIQNLETAAADSICIHLGFIDVFTSMLKDSKENTIDLMHDVSLQLIKYNDKVPAIFKKYSDGSTTNITIGDWKSMLVYYMYPDSRKKYSEYDKLENDLDKQITDGIDKPYAGFGTTYSKKSLEKLYDIARAKLSDQDLKDAIKELKDDISKIKKRYKEEIDAEKNKK